MTQMLPVEQRTAQANFRERLSLDGIWKFQYGGRGAWRAANVPNVWQAEFDDLRDRCGTALYKREFDLAESWQMMDLVLHFGAVNYFAEVKLNGVVLGTHEGGYLPFEFDLPRQSLAKKNELEVKVIQPSGDAHDHAAFPFAEIPHGKQSWYGPLSGIWQSVYV